MKENWGLHSDTISENISSHHKNIKNALAITGAIRGSSNEKMYQELGFEYSSMVKDILSFL